MTTADPRATHTELVRALTSVERVFVIPVSDDGQILLLRHEVAGHAYWAFPTMARSLPRTRLRTLASRLIREVVGIEASQLRLVAVIEPTRAHGRSAVYAAAIPAAGAQIIAMRSLSPAHRHPMQAMTFTADIVNALDIRPAQVASLLATGGDPARAVLQLPDLSDAATSGQADR